MFPKKGFSQANGVRRNAAVEFRKNHIMSTTRISDLPDNVTLQVQTNPGGVLPPAVETRAPDKLGNDMINSQTTYVPLNVHANPFGHPPQTPNGQMPSFPEQQQQQQQRLPSRDIPMNSLEFQQDAEIQANYVPRQRMASDYVRDYEQDVGRDRRQVDRRKVALQTADDWYQRLQIPILVTLLFFIFQMPVFNTFLRKNFTFLTIYNDDGNFNIVGLVFKSILFGTLFYSMQQFLVNFGSD
jgi:hypothetical protein